MKQLESSASQMAEKGIVKRPMQQQEQTPTTVGSFVPPPTQTFQTGGSVTAPINPALPQQFIPQTQYDPNLNIQDLQARQAQAPSLPTGATVVPTGIMQSPSQAVGGEQGQVSGAITTPTAQATTTVATAPTPTQAQTITPTTTQEQVDQLQGLAKAWVDLNGGTADDSFNVASDTDNGTGSYSITYTNNMGNANCSVSGSAGTDENVMHCITLKPTTGLTVKHRDYGNSLADIVHSMSTVHGDLA